MINLCLIFICFMHDNWYINTLFCIFLYFYLYKQNYLHTFASESEYIYSYESEKQ